MKKYLFLIIIFSLVAGSCSKEKFQKNEDVIPNSDFEIWNGWSLPFWNGNNCPACSKQILTDIVKQSTDAYSGKYAVELLNNNVYPAFIQNKFAISSHPNSVNGYIKATLVTGDTVIVQISLYRNNVVVDSGKWIGLESLPEYTAIHIPISQNAKLVDSAKLYIRGGQKKTAAWSTSTVLLADDFTLR
ncbi:MAG: hypothetical protein JWP94_1780 [Mucilaginibacter sp.]|nr:hypothetical protein [Mucilaginibacter sp.]